jgi:hypothetical protein
MIGWQYQNGPDISTRTNERSSIEAMSVRNGPGPGRKYSPMTKTLFSRPAVEPQNRLPNLSAKAQQRNHMTNKPMASVGAVDWLLRTVCLPGCRPNSLSQRHPHVII